MRWTDMDEKEMIKTWAQEKHSEDLMQEYFSKPEAEKESYWCMYDKGNEIVEYGFDTVPELKRILETELKEEFYKDLILPLVVATFKEEKIMRSNTEKLKYGQDTHKDMDDFSIPEFVYVF